MVKTLTMNSIMSNLVAAYRTNLGAPQCRSTMKISVVSDVVTCRFAVRVDIYVRIDRTRRFREIS